MYEYSCKIVRVVDGDTVDVDIDLGFGMWVHKERIRLHGIDTLITVQDKAGKYGRILGKFRIHDGKEDRQTTINEWMIENHYAVAYHGQSKEAVADEHLKNYQEIVEGVDITQDELDVYINSRS